MSLFLDLLYLGFFISLGVGVGFAQTLTPDKVNDVNSLLIYIILSMIGGIGYLLKTIGLSAIKTFQQLEKTVERNNKILLLICDKHNLDDSVKILINDTIPAKEVGEEG